MNWTKSSKSLYKIYSNGIINIMEHLQILGMWKYNGMNNGKHCFITGNKYFYKIAVTVSGTHMYEKVSLSYHLSQKKLPYFYCLSCQLLTLYIVDEYSSIRETCHAWPCIKFVLSFPICFLFSKDVSSSCIFFTWKAALTTTCFPSMIDVLVVMSF